VFDKTKLHQSSVLSPQNVSGTEGELMSTEQECQHLLRTLQGNKQGKYQTSRGEQVSKVQKLKNKIEAVMQQFNQRNKRRVVEGSPPMQELPEDLQEQRLMLEAKLDVALEEVDAVKKQLKSFEEQTEEVADDQMLKYGPQGHVTLQGGIPAEVDGQKANVNENGIPVIEDKRSPYDGLTVMAYKALVVQPWLESRNQINREKQQEYEAAIEAGENAKPPRRLKPNASIPKDQWPERPSDEAIKEFHDEIGLSDLQVAKATDEDNRKRKSDIHEFNKRLQNQ
jgi:hypothetical protein